MNARTGQTLWSTTVPNDTQANGPITVANGVVFAGSTYKTGPIYAIDAITGKILWSNVTGATVFGGISVSDGCIYVGSGYKVAFGVVTPSFSGGTSLFALCVVKELVFDCSQKCNVFFLNNVPCFMPCMTFYDVNCLLILCS